jgi:hypothetical protein
MRIFFLLVDEPFYTPACVGRSSRARFVDRWRRVSGQLLTGSGSGPRSRCRLFTTAGGSRTVASVRGGVSTGSLRRADSGHGVADVNAALFVDMLRRLQVDLIVSINTPQRLKAPFHAAGADCLNVHFGMLLAGSFADLSRPDERRAVLWRHRAPDGRKAR